MSDLVVRRLLIDLGAPFDRHWCGGDAFRTALFNALSMSFPVGEQFFIDSVRAGFRTLSPTLQDHYRDEVQGFVGQEATHRRLHARDGPLPGGGNRMRDCHALNLEAGLGDVNPG